MWPALGVNYKSVNKVAADIQYLRDQGIHYIRPHIPQPTGSTTWRAVAKQFVDASTPQHPFYVLHGSTGSNITKATWQSYHDAVITEAQYCKDNNICHEFGAGNELELHSLGVSNLTQTGGVATVTTSIAHGFVTGDTVRIEGALFAGYNGSFIATVTGSTTFTYPVDSALTSPAVGGSTKANNLSTTELNANLRSLATELKALFGTGPDAIKVSYQSSIYTNSNNDILTNGKGDFDYWSMNVYSGFDTNLRRFRGDHKSIVQKMVDKFGSGFYLSEFNVEAGDVTFKSLTDSQIEEELQNMVEYFKQLNISRCHVYQYRAYNDSDASDAFWLRYSNDTFRTPWNALIANRRRRIVI